MRYELGGFESCSRFTSQDDYNSHGDLHSKREINRSGTAGLTKIKICLKRELMI